MEQARPPETSVGRRVVLALAIPGLALLAGCCFIGVQVVRLWTDPPYATVEEMRSEPLFAPPPGGVEISREEIGANPIPFLPPQGHVEVTYASDRDTGELARWYMSEYGKRYGLEGYTEPSGGRAFMRASLPEPPRSTSVTVYDRDSPLLDEGYKQLKMPAGTRTIVSVGISNNRGRED